MDLDALLARAEELRASDVHISPGQPPALRVDGVLQPVGEPVSGAETKTILRQLASDSDREQPKEQVFSYQQGGARYRVSAFTAQNRTCLALRRVPPELPTLSDLGLEGLRPLLAAQGLILVSGPAGSGRSWTAASLLREINATRSCHILTLEDMLEHPLPPKQAHVTHRIVGRDLPYRLEGIRQAVHLDADVLYAGELSEGSLFEAALEAAEAGLLVIATMTAGSANRALLGLMDLVPAARRPQRRETLTAQLRTALYQRLVPDPKGGRRPTFEVLEASAVAALLSP